MTTEDPAALPFDKLEIPDEWKDEPKIKLGAKAREYAVAPMSGRNIAKFTALAIGLKTGRDMTQGDVDANLEQLYKVVHFGLIRAYPALSFDAFYDSDARPDQLQEAFEIVAKAAGIEFKVIAPGEAAAAPSIEKGSSKDGTTS